MSYFLDIYLGRMGRLFCIHLDGWENTLLMNEWSSVGGVRTEFWNGALY